MSKPIEWEILTRRTTQTRDEAIELARSKQVLEMVRTSLDFAIKSKLDEGYRLIGRRERDPKVTETSARTQKLSPLSKWQVDFHTTFLLEKRHV